MNALTIISFVLVRRYFPRHCQLKQKGQSLVIKLVVAATILLNKIEIIIYFEI